MKNHLSIIFFTILLTVFFAAFAQAEFPCAAPTGRGMQDSYTLSVEPFSQEYRFEEPLTIPLTVPVTEKIPVGRFLVVVKEKKDPDARARGPLDLGGALAGAYAAAAREPDKLKEFFYGPGRSVFDQSCSDIIKDALTQNKMKNKVVNFESPGAEASFEGGQWLRTCQFPSTEGRVVEARIYFKKDTKDVRKNRRDAGKILTRFTLKAEGSVEEKQGEEIFLKFSIAPDPVIMPIDTPEDIPANIVNLATIPQKDKITSRLKALTTKLTNERRTLSASEQAVLCSNKQGGRIAKTIPFDYMKEKKSADIIITSKYARVLNERLGVDCKAINCDCDNLDAGLLTGPWQDECRSEEAAAQKACEQNGKAEGCSFSGPNPVIPQ